jgi:hypothetical protein
VVGLVLLLLLGWILRMLSGVVLLMNDKVQQLFTCLLLGLQEVGTFPWNFSDSDGCRPTITSFARPSSATSMEAAPAIVSFIYKRQKHTNRLVIGKLIEHN